MTIRQSLRLWYRFYLIAGVAFAAVAAFLISRNQIIPGIVLCVLTMVATAVFSWRFRCPRCGTSLMTKLMIILSERPRVACPKCGVSMDEPV
jgi:hypothetical protein